MTDFELPYEPSLVEDWLKKRYESVKPDIMKMKDSGFKPLFYSVMLCEDTFVFRTSEEASLAYEKFEKDYDGEESISGWWYGIEEFYKVF